MPGVKAKRGLDERGPPLRGIHTCPGRGLGRVKKYIVNAADLGYNVGQKNKEGKHALRN